MAEALVSIVLEQLGTFIVDQVKGQVEELRMAIGIKKEIQSLSLKLKMIKEALDDAERKKVKDKNVKHWLEILEDFSYDTDNVLDEWRTRILQQEIERNEAAPASIPRKKVSCFILPSCFTFKKLEVNRDIVRKIKELDVKLEEIVREKDQFYFVVTTNGGVVSDQGVFKRVMTTGIVDESSVHGRDSDKDVIIRKLLESNDQENGPLVISVVGTGGIGKTTLAQLAYGDEKLKGHFDERIWICVSDPFDEVKIAKAILEALTKSSPNLSQLHMLLERIQECISKKMFFLVLDDVWSEDYSKWEPLKNSLKNGARGSRILVTSRSERVVGMMGSSYMHRLGQISNSDCLSLFSRIAFSGRTNEDRENLEDIGERIVRKCKGLPLAAKTMGSLLRFKVTEQEWQTVLDNQIWELEEVTIDLFPHLYLSYDDLPPILKRCFSYCAIFPKDTVINVDRLIRIWMAQGYLSTVENNQQEAKGREYFMNLAMRSFFHELKTDDKNASVIISCKMHDVVHDFAQFLSRNDCYSITGTEETENKEKVLRVYHLCWDRTDSTVTPISVCDIGKIRSLFAEHLLAKDLTRDLSKGLKCLRVLNLHGCGMQELPEEVGNLCHLRYIDLSRSKVENLPESISCLCNLQTLDLYGCKNLSRLPKQIGKLINLRHLITTDTPKLEFFPQGIGKLAQLRTLGDFIVGKGSSKLGYIGKLNQLQGYVSIHVIDNLNDAEDVIEAQKAALRNKQYIKELRLNFYWKSEVSMDVMEALIPPPNLRFLTINGYRGTRFPTWIPLSLNNLRVLTLSECFNCTFLPPLGKLPFLEILWIRLMDELKHVGNEFLGLPGTIEAFPKLKKLRFSCCSEWEEWTDLKQEVGISVMPSLKELELNYCEKLKSLPYCLLQKVSSLESLKIKMCPCLELHWNEISHIQKIETDNGM
ncbi:putative disease resistance protein RGA3 [Lycium barbarum]|uniref:putative disease resistance protein RGA3 n=1 Tax=Lycium barbarum TaxID=112863 RepID=UPI00293EAFFB|nr:putative disease resistance protein RGA3 [Lycium barbarum]